jgi:hypothetical protein
MLNNINNNDIEFDLPKIFNKKMPFLKIAYVNDNISNNIFYNYKLYKILFNNKFLSIININSLNNYLNNFDFEIYINNQYSNNSSDSFLNDKQIGNRDYSENGNYILPIYIREILLSFNLLYYFDVPDDFIVENYKNNNIDLKNMSKKELYLHWINYGRVEDRKYI